MSGVKLLCPGCVEEGLKSTVSHETRAHYLMAWRPYWDEEGDYHVHDPNSHASWFRCSNGHVWPIPNLCPAEDCDFNVRRLADLAEHLPYKKADK